MKDDAIEVVKFYHKVGKEYVRDMYDLEGNWVGIETRVFATVEDAKKLGYKPE